ncbi:hypothetical protein COT64_02565 [Candidatus Shapirobacteria bacterium CG09_land_8_20_14_0_10_39_12]|uniref:Uncharacterized protein n=1 Tax=Candidatus Shapirobacteria bacterium CG09_land_8_20_14_0_10_39_12 TaxID=1974885 RepID=A0A2H0WP71_9BACT|nr:MAG: hypothetical protein COT64_02565 [Candidatus Shapirobacteria bacterium CG09_land_8_20_14_0_10_39_12]
MTKKEEKEVIRVCGENYDEIDIPAYIRRRDEEKARALDAVAEEYGQEEKERREGEEFEELVVGAGV